jgi:peptidoglycan hydrolase-like protein with peptidoglycan-binding domain
MGAFMAGFKVVMIAMAAFALGVTPVIGQAPAMQPIAQLDMSAVPRLNEDAIRKVQVLLKQKGFEPGPTDGIVGPLTKGAVRAFQERYGLNVGEIDNQTLFALGAADLASAGGTSN